MGYSDKREAQKFHFKNNDSLYSCVVILSVNTENTLIIGMWRVNIIANIKRHVVSISYFPALNKFLSLFER